MCVCVCARVCVCVRACVREYNLPPYIQVVSSPCIQVVTVTSNLNDVTVLFTQKSSLLSSFYLPICISRLAVQKESLYLAVY